LLIVPFSTGKGKRFPGRGFEAEERGQEGNGEQLPYKAIRYLTGGAQSCI